MVVPVRAEVSRELIKDCFGLFFFTHRRNNSLHISTS